MRRIKPGPLLWLGMMVSPDAFVGRSITDSPRSIGPGLARGNELVLWRGVLEGLEALEGVRVGNREFGVVARGEVREGAEEGFGVGGREVITRGSFGCLENEESFELG